MPGFAILAQQCAPAVHPMTLQALVRTESDFNPYAIGVVGGHLTRQPRTVEEAVSTARALVARGINFSMGLGQINRANLTRYGLTYESAFDPCANLRAGSAILQDCYGRARAAMAEPSDALRAAISCYYSGNFTRGQRVDATGTSYVQRVTAQVALPAYSPDSVPALPVVMERPAERQVDHDGVRVQATGQGVGARAHPEALHPAWDAFGDYGCEGQSCR